MEYKREVSKVKTDLRIFARHIMGELTGIADKYKGRDFDIKDRMYKPAIKCTHCDKTIPQDSEYCPYCGRKFGTTRCNDTESYQILIAKEIDDFVLKGIKDDVLAESMYKLQQIEERIRKIKELINEEER